MPRNRSRYIGIFRGGRAEEIDKLIRYLRGTDRAEYPERRGNRPQPKTVYTRPFMSGVPTTLFLEGRVNPNRYPTVQSALGNHTVETVTNEQAVISAPGLYNPKACFTWGISNTGSPRTSQMTGRNYNDYGGTSTVAPFGKVVATDNPQSVFSTIRSDFVGQATDRRVTYIPPSY